MTTNKTKQKRYMDLVNKRKNCIKCNNNIIASMVNISNIPILNKNNRYDIEHIGPWSCWQGNLDSNVLIVGNDWMSIEYLDRNKKFYEKNICRTDQTNKKIVKYVNDSIFKEKKMSLPRSTCNNNEIFMTQAVLCLKNKKIETNEPWPHDKTAPRECFNNCSEFLKDTIEIIFPRDEEKLYGAVVTLSRCSTEIVLNMYYNELKKNGWAKKIELLNFNFEQSIDSSDFTMTNNILNKLIVISDIGIPLYNNIRLFPMQHPSRDCANRSKIEKVKQERGFWARQVEKDWEKIGNYLG